ncbi:MAG: phosphotransferase family protein [Dehalococcoidia bacterium]|nr:phosphotransferase family protein [Dehalococcoidia bacterium]
MQDALERYLAGKLGADSVTVRDLERVFGGASRETWTFAAEYTAGGVLHTESLVLRKDPPASLLESNRDAEYAFYSGFAGSAVPVPRMRWLEPDPDVLGGPFFVMDRIEGCEASPQRLLHSDYDAVRDAIARRQYEILAALHAHDWHGTPIADAAAEPAREECWRRELDYWESVIDAQELEPQPIARAAIRWLRANPPPPPARVTPVHGDYRVGNLLVRTDGDIHGILDWEMAHLGDPVEDLAWSFMEAWEWARDGRKGGIIDQEEAIRIYEEAGGSPVDRDALHWWDIFSGIKGQAIWLTGARSYQEGESKELILAMTSYWLSNFQDEILLRSMGRVP